MARTDKQGIRKKKQQQSSSGAMRFSNPRINISLNDAKEIGIVIPQENPSGRTFHWFVRGRKDCFETKMKWDRDGYRFYKHKDVWMCCQIPMPNWARRRLRKLV